MPGKDRPQRNRKPTTKKDYDYRTKGNVPTPTPVTPIASAGPSPASNHASPPALIPDTIRSASTGRLLLRPDANPTKQPSPKKSKTENPTAPPSSSLPDVPHVPNKDQRLYAAVHQIINKIAPMDNANNRQGPSGSPRLSSGPSSAGVSPAARQQLALYPVKTMKTVTTGPSTSAPHRRPPYPYPSARATRTQFPLANRGEYRHITSPVPQNSRIPPHLRSRQPQTPTSSSVQPLMRRGDTLVQSVSAVRMGSSEQGASPTPQDPRIPPHLRRPSGTFNNSFSGFKFRSVPRSELQAFGPRDVKKTSPVKSGTIEGISQHEMDATPQAPQQLQIASSGSNNGDLGTNSGSAPSTQPQAADSAPAAQPSVPIINGELPVKTEPIDPEYEGPNTSRDSPTFSASESFSTARSESRDSSLMVLQPSGQGLDFSSKVHPAPLIQIKTEAVQPTDFSQEIEALHDIKITPRRFYFNSPFIECKKTLFLIQNRSDRHIAFRIHFPNNSKRIVATHIDGIIAPNETLPNNIICKPFEFDERSNQPEKFVIRWTNVPRGHYHYTDDWFDELDGMIGRKTVPVDFSS